MRVKSRANEEPSRVRMDMPSAIPSIVLHLVYIYLQDSISHTLLVNKLASEWHTKCPKQKSGMSIGSCGCFYCDMETGDHVWGVHLDVLESMATRLGQHAYIIIDFNLWK